VWKSARASLGMNRETTHRAVLDIYMSPLHAATHENGRSASQDFLNPAKRKAAVEGRMFTSLIEGGLRAVAAGLPSVDALVGRASASGNNLGRSLNGRTSQRPA
jgi:hypothetical protein